MRIGDYVSIRYVNEKIECGIIEEIATDSKFNQEIRLLFSHCDASTNDPAYRVRWLDDDWTWETEDCISKVTEEFYFQWLMEQ